EVEFLRKVNELHPDAEGKPFVIGNCQGGWALMMLASLAPELVGPILLAASPVSYWAGVAGKNPMRYTGGLLGGSWMASLAGDLESSDGQYRIDIRNIREPIVVFASWGDNITPPQQALNWIPDVYGSVDEIRVNEQTIVYCLHKSIGHLGIFVSAGVAKRETAELASALDLIETLPPGLYEAVIEDTRPETPGLELVAGRYLIKFVPRTIDDILALDDGRDDEQAFEVVKRVSEMNQGLYDTFASPLVKSMSSEGAARAIRALNPARMERTLFSDMNPWMH